ncbi:hypothetical protein CDIOL_31160 [Clostridium diolis]|uniref:Uncharacterized protein n=1 Tax=Clostridium diolis TaxID=223919 RepID=A0AAV3W1R9_9CLOT|nr:hypothetical protein CDIOL_31160 [Clostridium diolis]
MENCNEVKSVKKLHRNLFNKIENNQWMEIESIFSRGTFITSIFKGNELNNMRIIIGFM